MGKGKDSAAEEASNHQSTPLSALKDPATFAPPPKRINSHGVAASHTTAVSSGGGLGTPPSQHELHAQEEERAARARAQREAEEEEANRPPPGPYQVNTTGLRTDHLPKPPVRRLDQAAQSSVSSATGAARPKPSLPPRLPPRQNSTPDMYAPSPPPTYQESVQTNPSPQQGYLNQGSLNNLSRAGVSVPGLNIGRNGSPPLPPRIGPPASGSSSPAATPRGPQLGELQARFSRMSTASPPTTAEPGTGTTFAQKQAAFNTADAFRNDPSSISLADARSAASTANNFRERHGEQVASGLKAGSGINQKYGVLNKVNSFASGSNPASPGSASPPIQSVAGKKPPPPPPPKKKDLTASPIIPGSPAEPPPVPLSSKPRW